MANEMPEKFLKVEDNDKLQNCKFVKIYPKKKKNTEYKMFKEDNDGVMLYGKY
jgi:hypothetical protein